jgi:hypothetical protein
MKIVLLLNEKGSISYTELMETLGFVTTGLFNYHLKVHKEASIDKFCLKGW